jgi:NADPH-dependent 2,4-dienoyl-CoA reductase/sulfur reductase-like enzyme
MELVRPGVRVEPVEGLPELPLFDARSLGSEAARSIETVRVPVLVIGGGPAGLSAAIELGKRGIETLLVDDKHRLGGKLVLQTHRFFGSIEAVFAGARASISHAPRARSARSRRPGLAPVGRLGCSATGRSAFSSKASVCPH